MGVQNLWLLLSPAAQKIPESQLESKRLAIDISIWVLHILHGYLSLGSASFENIHLLAVFKRLLRLLSLGVKPVFVFDGKVPELKKRTVAERAGARRVNMKKLAEKLIVKQLEGKKISQILIKKNEDSDPDEDQINIEEEDAGPKDLLQIFEEEVEKEQIKTLLSENGMRWEEFEKLDFATKRDLIRELKQRNLEIKQEKLKSIENKDEFSKVHLQEYIKIVEKKKEIEGRKKELGEKMNQEIVKGNIDKIEGMGGLKPGAKIEIAKDFLVIKKNADPEVERLRNLMGKIQKPERKTKKDKLKECDEKLTKLMESKETEEENERKVNSIENKQKKEEEKDKEQKTMLPKELNNNKQKEETKSKTNDLIVTRETNSSIISDFQTQIEVKNTPSSDNLYDSYLFDKPLQESERPLHKNSNDQDKNDQPVQEFMRPLDKKVLNKNQAHPIMTKEFDSSQELLEGLQKKTTNLVENNDFASLLDSKRLDSLRKEFLEEEVRRMVSSIHSRSSSKSSRKDPKNQPDENNNSKEIHSEPRTPQNKHPLTQEEILHEIEKMDAINPQTEDEMCIDQEMNDDFIRLSNLNTFGDSLSSKFEQIKNLFQLFGVPWVESPFEAEAQCAFLEMKGLVDGIITEDSDVFLFGGRRIYRKLFAGNQNKVDYFEIGNIEKELGLNREKCISLALFLGSDYTIGVKGIGMVNAMEIVNAFETVDSLFRFKVWAEKPDILLENSDSYYRNIPLKEFQYKHFHKNYKKNWELPDSFPDMEVVSAYKNPAVDDSLEPFVWNEPDIEGLKAFCREVFEWGNERIDEVGLELGKIVKRMREKKAQRRIDEFFAEKTIGVVKSKRLQAAIKGMKREEEEKKEEILMREIRELEDMNVFNYQRKKDS